MIAKRLIPVLSVVALPAGVALAAGDAGRFERLADGARASGALEMTLKFSGATETCGAAQTCGRSGTVVAKMSLDASKPAQVRDGELVVLRVTGTTTATVRDTVAGHVCHGKGSVSTTGIKYKGDAKGVLLRVGVAVGGDPFDTACQAPTLDDLGERVLPNVRVRNLSPRSNELRFRVETTRSFLAAGYTGTLRTRGTVRLRASS